MKRRALIATTAAAALVVALLAAPQRGGAQVAPVAPDPEAQDPDPGNWGKVPAALRPLFVRMETVSGVPGAARFFALVAARESHFVPTAHNDDEKIEVPASRKAYDKNVGKRPELVFGGQAREFGSGGLFGQLSPYFLWSGVQELGDKAPLLSMPPDAVFDVRLAAFGAVCNLRRIITLYPTGDLADARVGWAAVGLLQKKTSPVYHAVRKRFFETAEKWQIDTNLLPSPLVAGSWGGPAAAFQSLSTMAL